MTEPSIWHEVQTKLVQLSAKPNFLAIKAKGPDYAKNMKVISAKLGSLSVDEIKALQNGETVEKFTLVPDEGFCAPGIESKIVTVMTDEVLAGRKY